MFPCTWFSCLSMTVHWLRHQLYLHRISPSLPAKRSNTVREGKAGEELGNSKNGHISLSFLTQRSLGQGRIKESKDVSPCKRLIFQYICESHYVRCTLSLVGCINFIKNILVCWTSVVKCLSERVWICCWPKLLSQNSPGLIWIQLKIREEVRVDSTVSEELWEA